MTSALPTPAPALLVLGSADDVAVAMRELHEGDIVSGPTGTLTVTTNVPAGHKIALRDVPVGAHVHKYGQSIGVATAPIVAGGHVHSHNLGYVEEAGDYEIATVDVELPDTEKERTFDGYHRVDGRVGTRNYIGILASVNCSASNPKPDLPAPCPLRGAATKGRRVFRAAAPPPENPNQRKGHVHAPPIPVARLPDGGTFPHPGRQCRQRRPPARPPHRQQPW